MRRTVAGGGERMLDHPSLAYTTSAGLRRFVLDSSRYPTSTATKLRERHEVIVEALTAECRRPRRARSCSPCATGRIDGTAARGTGRQARCSRCAVRSRRWCWCGPLSRWRCGGAPAQSRDDIPSCPAARRRGTTTRTVQRRTSPGRESPRARRGTSHSATSMGDGPIDLPAEARLVWEPNGWKCTVCQPLAEVRPGGLGRLPDCA